MDLSFHFSEIKANSVIAERYGSICLIDLFYFF